MILNYTSTTNVRGQINAVLEVQDATQGATSGSPYVPTEPVTLQEVKDYAKIDYTDDDDLITALITASRQQLEKYTGLSFIPKRLIAALQNDCGGIEIPYGPVVLPLDDTLIVDAAGEETSITVRGLEYPFIETQINYVQITYDAGFTDLPSALKTAIKAQTFFLYENRGEKIGFGAGDSVRQYNPDFVCNAAIILCAKYKRVWDAIM